MGASLSGPGPPRQGRSGHIPPLSGALGGTEEQAQQLPRPNSSYPGHEQILKVVLKQKFRFMSVFAVERVGFSISSPLYF